MEADYVLDYDVLSVAREHRLYLMARIQAGPPPDASTRRPLNLSVVLDRSSSMSGDKLEFVKKAAQFLVQRLAAKDTLSLVTYNEMVTVDAQPGPASHKDDLIHAIKGIRASGTTNLSGGWLKGCQLVEQNKADGQVNRVLLLTDGLANEGVTDPARLTAMTRQMREGGITTTTMGVGLDFNEDLLANMASEGGGAFYFIDNPDQAPRIFSEELADLMSVVGQNLSITLNLSPEVQIVTQLNAYPADAKGREITFHLGDLYGEEIKRLVLELKIPQLETLGQVEVARLSFEYDELGQDRVRHRVLEMPITVDTVPEDQATGQAPNAEVVRSALLLQAARAREEAVQHADKGRFDEASQVLTRAAEAIEQSSLEDDELQAEHNMLREEAVDMELGAQRYDSQTRKTHTQKIYQGTHSYSQEDTIVLHARLKSSRPAVERLGPAPKRITWRREGLDLDRDKIRIGRASDNDIVIPEDEVSVYHCEIVREGDTFYLEDLNSTNGSYANGGRVRDRFRLSAGDVLTIGFWLFILK